MPTAALPPLYRVTPLLPAVWIFTLARLPEPPLWKTTAFLDVFLIVPPLTFMTASSALIPLVPDPVIVLLVSVAAAPLLTRKAAISALVMVLFLAVSVEDS